MRQMERDGEHIWLRQSVTFTASGQTRTVEIAIPLRPGASQDEIEALLREADAGMMRLSRHLDARVAALTSGEVAPELPVPAPFAREQEPPAPAEPAPASLAPAVSPSPVGASSGRPPTPAPVPAAPPVQSATPREEPPAAPGDRPSGAVVREPPAPSGPPAAPLLLPQFLQTAQAELGLNSRQAMEKLGVRSLSGLNLHEALEALRRQMLRGEGTAPPAASSPPEPAPPLAAPSPARSSETAAPPPTQAPRYFEEELDEPEIAFSEEDDAAPVEELDLYAASDGRPGKPEGEAGALDELDLEDVPDFGAPPAPAVPTAPTRASAGRAHHTSAARAPGAPPMPTQSGSVAEGEGRSRGVEQLGALRSAKAGGVPSSQQRTAYRNIVARELGEEKARALVQGVYKAPPERLGPEQLDALVSWGKQETFAEEVELVLAALRAAAAGQAPANGAAGSSPRRTQRTQREPEE